MTSPVPFSTVLMPVPECPSSIHVEPQDLHHMVSTAFLTALLLTGSAERAEAALLQAKGVLGLDNTSGEALLRRAVNAAIEPPLETVEQPSEDLERASSSLPCELRRVLHLRPALRHCFVLRFLVGLPREVCARLLHLEVPQIDERARTAMLELPTIQKNGTC
ncbi:MAG: hypothetical protein LAP39_14875 [Acidobacteriia bacterium]|nr:hypothetical protein [Terriglobia bacterium]